MPRITATHRWDNMKLLFIFLFCLAIGGCFNSVRYSWGDRSINYDFVNVDDKQLHSAQVSNNNLYISGLAAYTLGGYIGNTLGPNSRVSVYIRNEGALADGTVDTGAYWVLKYDVSVVENGRYTKIGNGSGVEISKSSTRELEIPVSGEVFGSFYKKVGFFGKTKNIAIACLLFIPEVILDVITYPIIGDSIR